MDYFCGYCKKIHPELINIVNERDDVRIVFLQYPIISQKVQKCISKFVVAANFQNKGFESTSCHFFYVTRFDYTKKT